MFDIKLIRDDPHALDRAHRGVIGPASGTGFGVGRRLLVALLDLGSGISGA